jgi:L-asparaginase
MNSELKLVFIQTGGTIDKDYPHTTKGWAFEFGEPASIRILEKFDPSFQYSILTVFQKDSLEIVEEDLKTLADLINEQEDTKIIVTHGTDTMIETASYLNDRISNKLVIITGAMRPERFKNSDAELNLGSAIGAANILDTGVFIAMHGIVKPFAEMARDMENGKYY